MSPVNEVSLGFLEDVFREGGGSGCEVEDPIGGGGGGGGRLDGGGGGSGGAGDGDGFVWGCEGVEMGGGEGGDGVEVGGGLNGFGVVKEERLGGGSRHSHCCFSLLALCVC